MSRKYVCFIPTDPRLLPPEADIASALETLLARGIVQRSTENRDALTNGPQCHELFRDTDPKKSGDGLGTDPGRMRFRVESGEIAGYCGDNLEPVACEHCNSELPYSAAQDAFWALRDGSPIDDPRMTMECYHCGKPNPALDADWGRSGGFSRLAFIFEGETSNRVEANKTGLELLSAALKTPVRFVQVHSW